MAASLPKAPRRASRGGRQTPRATGKTASDSIKENNFGRSTLLKQRPTVLPDLDNDTPRFMLKRIIQTQPQVSPLAPQISKHEETEEAGLEPPSKRISSTVEMQLPDLVPEDTSMTTFYMTRKKKKFSISEFERAADKRLPQNQTQSTLDSTSLARSLHMSLGSLIPPDTVEKRGLLRRPKNHKAIDMEAFEGGVEQNMLQRKAQNYLVDSQTASMIRRATLMSDAEIMMSNTELFVQPQFGEQSQHRLSALEPQLPESKISAQGSKTFDAAHEEARLVGLVSNVGTHEGRTQRYSEKNLIVDYERVGRMTPVSPKTFVSQGEDHQSHFHQSDPMEQFSVPEEVVAGTTNRWSSSLPSRSSSRYLGTPVIPKTTRSFSMYLREAVSCIIEELDVGNKEEEVSDTMNGVEHEEFCREATEHHANAGYSEQLEKKLTKTPESQITKAQDARVETETTASEEEEVAEGSVEHLDSPKAEPEIARSFGAGSLSRHSHAFSSQYFEKSGTKSFKKAVEQAGELEDRTVTGEVEEMEEETTDDEAEIEEPESQEISMNTPAFIHAAAYKPLSLLSTPHPAESAVPKFPLQPLQAKPVPKSSGVSRRKMHEPELASSLIKKVFSHYVKMPVARDAFRIVKKCSERYFRQLSNDLEAYTQHAGRKTVEVADLEVLMRRQGLVTDKMPLHVLIERHLPLEYRKLLIPVAVSGNKIIPCK
ncbi:centromere protein T isoform X3 [Apteryx rowi]|uniref:centromere protein T isoform X3 n=1 Tax=Apteryx rowi TaxID=308060 RepID=UPI000E1D9707|nr:centromere protein T isoform X3 [Apteryx rowi]